MPGKPLSKEINRNSTALVPYLVKAEQQEHKDMYAYYEGLGTSRSLSKVCTKFNKSMGTVKLISRSFRWAERIERAEYAAAQDPLITKNVQKIDRTREKLIEVVAEIADTLHELMFISKDIRRGKLTPERTSRAEELAKALSTWGFEWKNPKDFRALIQTLKEIKAFNEESGKSVPAQATQINAEKFELHIRDD